MRLPEWIKSASRSCPAPAGVTGADRTVRAHRLHTVCEAARCPNQRYCYAKPTATFLILGDACTRNCGFCSVSHRAPSAPDPAEPLMVADAAVAMGLRYVVVTSVTRDDLPDGGSGHFAATIRAVRQRLPEARIEVLIPDFCGDGDSLKTVLDAAPDVLNHNVETVPRLYPTVRPQADYLQSLDLLHCAKEIFPAALTKSGLMVGLGEQVEEIEAVLCDLRHAGCDSLTIGQYLRPTKKHLPVVEYIHPDIFAELEQVAKKLGFRSVASGPLVRSSMNAEEQFNGS